MKFGRSAWERVGEWSITSSPGWKGNPVLERCGSELDGAGPGEDDREQFLWRSEFAV